MNIEPRLLQNLKAAGPDIALDATRVLLFGESFSRRVGFLLAEKYDFGTAQKINALFGALLRVTPFGKAEAQNYAAMLNVRNLLVHHGGTYTLRYLEEKTKDATHLTTNAFFHSEIVIKDDVIAGISFIEAITRKLAIASHKALLAYALEHGIRYDADHKQAMDLLRWFDDEQTNPTVPDHIST